MCSVSEGNLRRRNKIPQTNQAQIENFVKENIPYQQQM